MCTIYGAKPISPLYLLPPRAVLAPFSLITYSYFLPDTVGSDVSFRGYPIGRRLLRIFRAIVYMGLGFKVSRRRLVAPPVRSLRYLRTRASYDSRVSF